MNSFIKTMLFPFLFGGSLIYRAGLYLHRKTTISKQVDMPVISIGNITTGGTGKTPIVINILDELGSNLKKAVVSRGYKRKCKKETVVRSNDTDKYGDEPVLIKKRSPGTMVIVDKNRYKGAKCAKEQKADICILDDGFQSWELKRDLDILVIDCTSPFGGGNLIPLGRLREPIGALKRADCVILNRYNSIDKDNLFKIESRIKEVNTDIKIFHCFEQIKCFTDLKTGVDFPVEEFKNSDVFCFSGIGNPEAFYKLMKKIGATIQGVYKKKDHYKWSEKDIEKIKNQAGKNNLKIITTEKDAVRLPGQRIEGWFLKMGTEVKEKKEWKRYLNEIIN
ncbi:MAG: tetraacyldisaccharide 4'-kinase [Atribacterota bacterium]